MVLLQDGVYRTVLLLNEVGSVLQNGVFKLFFQNRVSEVVLSQIEINKIVLYQSNIVIVNYQLFNGVKIAVNFLSNTGDKIMNFLALIMTCGGDKLA